MFKQLQRYLPSKQVVLQWCHRYGWRLSFLTVLMIFLLYRDFEVQMNFNTISSNILEKSEQLSKNVNLGNSQPIAQTTSWQPKLPMKKQQQNYVKRFASVAQAEMEKFGIPASITLAQGLLESQAGQSPLATKHNNHFGIKCFSKKCKKGHCSNFSDDHHKDFFRIYPSAWESYRAHSLFLQKNRYKHLLQLSKSDYQRWAHGLKNAGYATDKRYAEKLIRLIEQLDLHQFDV